MSLELWAEVTPDRRADYPAYIAFDKPDGTRLYLVRVLFDEAVERMLAAWPVACAESTVADNEFLLDVPVLLARLLRAAVGEE